jgi:prepilin signal peptidase PulO-like enzyme (type II secretory pathway)
MRVFWLIFGFIFGLAIGSFLNCLMWRLYHKKSMLGRSICPLCGHQLSFRDNIPIISFILLKGHCRYCHKKISIQYPLVELISGLLFSLVVLKNFGYLPSFNFLENYLPIIQVRGGMLALQIIRDWLGVFTLLFIFVYDLKYQIIEDIVLLPAAGIVFILNLFLGWSWQGMMISLFLALVFFGLQYVLTKAKGIGLGDIRIGIFLAVFFANFRIFLVVLFLSYIIGALISLILIIFKEKKWSSQIPLGPFLSLGGFLILFFS